MSVKIEDKDKVHRGNAEVWKWIKRTESEASLAVNLGDEFQVGLTDLAEDKEIATKAVAFVVNASRKGIVKLCSEVGSIMKERQKLEKKIRCLKIQNSSLRRVLDNSVASSDSSSPAPQSCHTDSRSSLCCNRSDSGFLVDSPSPSSSFNRSHSVPSPVDDKSVRPNLLTVENEENHTRVHKKSLPEIVSSPDQNVVRVNARNLLEENLELKKMLHRANLEIERLKKLSRRRPSNQEIFFEDECQRSSDLDSPRSDNSFGAVAKPFSTTYPLQQTGAISTCICSSCAKLKNKSNSSIRDGPVKVGQRVTLKDQRWGIVKYVGHLEDTGEPNLLFIGVELKTTSGKNDGTFKNKRYFDCEPGTGIFVSVSDIIEVGDATAQAIPIIRRYSADYDDPTDSPFKNPSRKGYSLPMESSKSHQLKVEPKPSESSLRLCQSDGLTRSKSPVPEMHIIDMDLR
ncbi:DgyrCDS11231 [Dimorphilus gyrociliatus]|uniref:DgyrCDS11231 n=1 Tax=Dimorphilus gyrociliatus TaxID=2664684 RepID=A0A7I8W3Q4_9ANNE|nr:DgyrCDS11231 [Dimorphilus gyrociliatus]